MTGVPAPTGWETRRSDDPNATVWALPGEPVNGAFILERRLTATDYPHFGDRVRHAQVTFRGIGPTTDPTILHRAAEALHTAARWLETHHPPPPPDGQRTIYDALEAQ